jgi:hypothetical protein
MNPLLKRLLAGIRPTPAATPQLQELAAILGVSWEEARAIPHDPLLSYRPFTVRKRGGGRRRIVAPSGRLKLLQRRLLHQYLAKQPVHYAAMAFRPGCSIATHARQHLGQAMVLTVDLTDFFPATAAWRVRAWFRDFGWRDEALESLLRLCVYRGGLPQGAPTSPALSNLVNYPLDCRLAELAIHHGGRYSRYCDDLAFSWSAGAEPLAFRLEVEERLTQFGYQIQVQKGWRLQRAEERPEITGLVLAGRRLRLSERILARWRRTRSRSRRDAKSAAQLQGYAGLGKMLK